MEDKGKLHRIINSLSTGEKGYITKSFSCEGKNGAIYLQLFRIISANGADAEKELKLIPNLRYNKHYLYKLILNLLADYYSNSLSEISINKTLNHLEILFKKGLLKDFKSNLDKLKSTCYKYENYSVIIRILKLERQYFNTQNYDNYNSQKLSENHAEYKSALEKINNLNEYRFLSKKLFFIIKSKGPIKTESDLKELYDIMKNPFLTDEENALTIDARMSFLKSNAFYCIIRKEYKEAYHYNTKLLHLFRSNPSRKKILNKEYLAVTANQIHLCINLKNYEEYKKLLTEYENLICSDTNLSPHQKIKLLDTKLFYYLKTFRLKEAGQLIEESKYLYDDRHNNVLDLILNFTFNIAYYYILNKEPQSAFFYIHYLLSHTRDNDSEIVYFTNILHLIAHYELGNFATLETLVKSTYKYLCKRNKIFKFETLVLRFIRSSYESDNENERIELMKELLFELKKLDKDSFQSSYKEIFNFQAWLESRINKISFAEALEKTNNENISDKYVKVRNNVSITGKATA